MSVVESHFRNVSAAIRDRIIEGAEYEQKTELD